ELRRRRWRLRQQPWERAAVLDQLCRCGRDRGPEQQRLHHHVGPLEDRCGRRLPALAGPRHRRDRRQEVSGRDLRHPGAATAGCDARHAQPHLLVPGVRIERRIAIRPLAGSIAASVMLHAAAGAWLEPATYGDPRSRLAAGAPLTLSPTSAAQAETSL